jgi:uncharacterized protein YdeI (YjbR/CyaY-like superfamily)
MTRIPENCLTFSSREEWRAWLEEHHATAQEAWLIHYKKKAARRSLALEEAVEEALCFGWIDGLLRSVDGDCYALRYSPRRPNSVWSPRNKERVEKLILEGRMTPAGLEKVARARESGEWEAADAREDVSAIPADLAWASFTRWPASRKKQYLYWLSSAKKPETRQKRIQAIVGMAAAEE